MAYAGTELKTSFAILNSMNYLSKCLDKLVTMFQLSFPFPSACMLLSKDT